MGASLIFQWHYKDGCADITDLDHPLRDQFVVGLKAGPVRRTLQEQIREHPTISFHDVVIDAVSWKQEDAEATVAGTMRYGPAHMNEEALSTLSAIHTKLRELTLYVASLKQELSSLKQDSVSSLKGENPLQRDTRGGMQVLVVQPFCICK